MNSAETIERVPIHTDADGVVRVAGTRVTLDTIVAAFDAGATAGRFFLATGGDTENKTTKLRQIITRGPQGSSGTPPADLPSFE